MQKENTYLERADYTWSQDSIRYINTPSQTARHIFYYVQEVGDFRTKPPYFTERENLNSFLIIYTLSGEGELHLYDQDYRLTPHTAAWINCMEHHRYACAPHQAWEFLWLHFHGPSALGYYQEFMKSDFRILDNLDHSMMEQTMRKILSFTQTRTLQAEISVSGLIMQLMTEMLLANSRHDMGFGMMPDFIRKALKIIETRYVEDLSLDDLSAELGVNKYYFAHEFRTYTGTPPREYIITERINHAKEMLKFTDMSVDEIAGRCGFHQTSHFINLFKKHERETPLKYRNKWGHTV
ncbi:MAG: AraC family transcriptional regulator [Bilifractor sp.]|jgi:AraC-like DNA-binding protein